MLAFGAHPDDVEIGAGGTVIASVRKGFSVGVMDLTQGELGSRGSGELRLQEAQSSARLMGLAIRENLALRDGFFEIDEDSILRIVEKIRLFQPRIVLCNAPSDRHPDHGRAAALVTRACFLSGLSRIVTTHEGVTQSHWRPQSVYHYIQDYYLKPDFVMDVTYVWEDKLKALQCFSSQFYQANSSEPQTPISGAEYFDFLRGRAMEMGRPAGYLLAEGFIATRTPGVEHLFQLQ